MAQELSDNSLLLKFARESQYDAWPYRDEVFLKSSRSRQVCITCYWFRHHAGVNCIPLLTCQLHEGLISHGDHLSHRWTQDLAAPKGLGAEGDVNDPKVDKC